MIQKARREYAEKHNTSSDSNIEDQKDPPTFISGFFMILAGSYISIFFLPRNVFLALAAGTPFILIGMQRIIKASSVRYKKRTL